jgi:uncharacterized protein YbaA (DUF1428 family)
VGGFSNIANTISAKQDEEVWLELIFYRDSKQRDDVTTRMKNNESMGTLFRQFIDLIAPGTSCVLGEFGRL